MPPYCPLVGEEEMLLVLLLMAATLNNNGADGANDPIGHPEGDDLNHGEANNVPVNTSSDEEEEGEYETGHVDGGQGKLVPPLSSDSFEDDDDSGYESDFEDEEDCPPVPSFASFGVARRLIPAQHQESAPSTSGLGSSTKRSRDEGHTEQVSRKKHRRNPSPSTPGLSFSGKRSREEIPTELVTMKKQRRDSEDSSEDSAPSSSGLVVSSSRNSEEDYRISAPSTSGVSFSTTRNNEDDYRNSAPSTSGLVFSTSHWRKLSVYRWLDDSDSD